MLQSNSSLPDEINVAQLQDELKLVKLREQETLRSFREMQGAVTDLNLCWQVQNLFTTLPNSDVLAFIKKKYEFLEGKNGSMKFFSVAKCFVGPSTGLQIEFFPNRIFYHSIIRLVEEEEEEEATGRNLLKRMQ